MRPVDLALRWIDATDGLAEEVAPGVHQVVLGTAPPGFDRLEAITGDPEAAREDPGVELVAPGSALFHAIAEEARGRGRAARAFLVGLDAARHGDPARAVRFEGARIATRSARAREHRLALFSFHLVYESDERGEDLVEVGVDLSTGRIARRAAEAAREAPWSPERLEAWPLAPSLSAAEGYALAREELLRRTAAAITARTEELRRLREAEAARMARYYDDLCRDLEADRARRTPEATAARLVATRRERDRRLAELADKFRLRVRAVPAALLVFVQPKVHLELEARPERGPAHGLDVVWDPLVGAFEAPGCPSCGSPGFAFEPGPKGAVRCPGCPRPGGR